LFCLIVATGPKEALDRHRHNGLRKKKEEEIKQLKAERGVVQKMRKKEDGEYPQIVASTKADWGGDSPRRER